MSNVPDPFQPWRPPGYTPPPPEPVAPPPREVHTPAPRALPPVPPSPPVLIPLVLTGLAVLGLVLVAIHPAGHWTRVLAGFVCLALGVPSGIALARARRWRAGLLCAGAGVAAASLAWVFVPTSLGLSLWGAYGEADRLAADLRAAVPADVRAYDRETEARKRLVWLFPSFRESVEDAERAWVKRSMDRCAADLGKVPPGDMAAYHKEIGARAALVVRFPGDSAPVAEAELAWTARTAAAWASELERLPPADYAGLEKLRGRYRALPLPRVRQAERDWLGRSFAAVKPGDFAAARQAEQAARGHARLWPQPDAQLPHRLAAAWAKRTAEAAVAEAAALSRSAPAKASEQLRRLARALGDFGAYPEAEKILLGGRRQILQARLDAARRQVRELLARDRFNEVDDLARGFEAETGAEAAAVGEAARVAQFRAQCGIFRALAGSTVRGLTTPLLALRYPASRWPADLAVTAWLQTGRVFPPSLSSPAPRR